MQQDTQILRLELIQRINHLPTEALRQVNEFVSALETSFVSFYKKNQIRPEEQATEGFPEKYKALQHELSEVYGYDPETDDNIFTENITWDEYFAMGDEAQGQLWDKLSNDASEELEELEVPTHVLPV